MFSGGGVNLVMWSCDHCVTMGLEFGSQTDISEKGRGFRLYLFCILKLVPVMRNEVFGMFYQSLFEMSPCDVIVCVTSSKSSYCTALSQVCVYVLYRLVPVGSGSTVGKRCNEPALFQSGSGLTVY